MLRAQTPSARSEKPRTASSDRGTWHAILPVVGLGVARTKKISITIDVDVLASAQKRARAEKKTLSAFLSDEIAAAERQRNLRVALDELDREHGPLTEAELRKGRELLAAADRKMRKRRKSAA